MAIRSRIYKALSKMAKKTSEFAGPLLVGYELNEQLHEEDNQLVEYVAQQVREDQQGIYHPGRRTVILLILIILLISLVAKYLKSLYDVIRRNRRKSDTIELKDI